MGKRVSRFCCHPLTPGSHWHDEGTMNNNGIFIPKSYDEKGQARWRITPEIARQIVAMARDSNEEAQFPQEARVLDKPAEPTRTAMIRLRRPSDNAERDFLVSAHKEMAEWVSAPVASVVRCQTNDGLIPYQCNVAADQLKPHLDQTWKIMPTTPTDYEAAVKALTNAFRDANNETYVGDARTAVELVRNGKVPGLTTLDKCSELINEHARALNERDTLKIEVAQRIKERDHFVEQCSRWIVEVKELKSELLAERAKGNCQGDYELEITRCRERSLTAEVERLRAELSRCVGTLVTKEKLDAAISRGDEHLNARNMMTEACEEAIAQRDAALVERDAAIARAEKAEREAQAWKEDAENNEADARTGEQACMQ
jgi:hypothetical protein